MAYPVGADERGGFLPDSHPVFLSLGHTLMTHRQQSTLTSRYGFTLVEILVVIAIIAILAGILLSALGGVQESAKKTKTVSLMQSFARACDMFALDHGRYPGLLPESAIDGVIITSMQNALLELMGGGRVQNENSPNAVTNEFSSFESSTSAVKFEGINDDATDLDWDIVFDQSRFGEGPWIAGRKYEPYFSPKASDLLYQAYNPSSPDPNTFVFPTLKDAWDTPILCFRSTRSSGPIIAFAESGSDSLLPQFEIQDGVQFYDSTNQPLNNNLSLLSPETLGGPDDEHKLAYLTLLLAHPSFWDITTDNAPTEFTGGVAWGTTRGRYMLLSAGSDTVYLDAAHDELHTEVQVDGNPLSGLIDPTSGEVTPAMMEVIDDIVVYGGG